MLLNSDVDVDEYVVSTATIRTMSQVQCSTKELGMAAKGCLDARHYRLNVKHLLVGAGSAAALVRTLATVQAAETAVQANDAGPVVQNSQAMAAASQAGLNLRQRIQDQLTEDGCTAKTVVPSSFFARAKNKQSDPVAMVIGPDTFTEVTDVVTRQAADAAPATPSSAPKPAQQ